MRKPVLFLLLCVVFYSCNPKQPSTRTETKSGGSTPGTLPTSGKILGNDNPPSLFPVLMEGKWGYIDKQGKLVLKADFAGGSRFSEGLAAVQMVKAGRVGFIDETGKVVIPIQFDLADPFSEGYSAVWINHKWGFIDRTGRLAIPATFDAALHFTDGAAVVGTNFPSGMAYFYINKNGEPLLDPAIKFLMAMPFGQGLAPVRQLGQNIRFIDHAGKTVIPPTFLGAANFADGLAPVYVHANEGMRWGYVGKDGKLAITAKYAAANPFQEGLGPVQVLGTGKWGYVNAKGSMTILPKFDAAGPFFNGMAQVMIGEKMAYIDPAGKYIWELK
jgi:hypothetical protein